MSRKKPIRRRQHCPRGVLPSEKIPPLAELLERQGWDPGNFDIALLNLLCAAGLPGSENLGIANLLEKVGEWSRLVKLETERNYYKFLDAPSKFNSSQAYFCVLCMITVLQNRCGVCYNARLAGITPDGPEPLDFGKDSCDLFIHAIIDGRGGTCGSLPVLYAAVGRRLGYPLKIVKAHRHLFLRWDDPRGKRWFHPARFNIEATGPGVHCLPDEHYRSWPHEVAAEDVEAGIFLKSLSPREELAEFVATRAHCLVRNGRLAEAIKAMRKAAELAPHNRHFQKSCDEWESRRKLLVRAQRAWSNPPPWGAWTCPSPNAPWTTPGLAVPGVGPFGPGVTPPGLDHLIQPSAGLPSHPVLPSLGALGRPTDLHSPNPANPLLRITNDPSLFH